MCSARFETEWWHRGWHDCCAWFIWPSISVFSLAKSLTWQLMALVRSARSVRPSYGADAMRKSRRSPGLDMIFVVGEHPRRRIDCLVLLPLFPGALTCRPTHLLSSFQAIYFIEQHVPRLVRNGFVGMFKGLRERTCLSYCCNGFCSENPGF